LKVKYHDIISIIDEIDPILYSKNRNFIDGSVSKISPYISRGLISTKQVFMILKEKGFKWYQIEKYVQELAWRDYWQLIWQVKNIDIDLKSNQIDVKQHDISTCIIDHKTDIRAIDDAIKNLYTTGYIHNHLRMYIASLVTNIAKTAWLKPAKWMYYHLLDGDWGSNALSWQWVAGTNSNRKYYMNQDNINKYTKTNQKNTLIDTSYDSIINLNQPEIFSFTSNLELSTTFPESTYRKNNDNHLPILIYNYYNLDIKWRSYMHADRVLLIEPSKFKKYPISEKCMQFFIKLSKNIEGIMIYVGEFEDLLCEGKKIFFKEHPLNYNYSGNMDQRDWLSDQKGYYPSFFKYWNLLIKKIKY